MQKFIKKNGAYICGELMSETAPKTLQNCPILAFCLVSGFVGDSWHWCAVGGLLSDS